MKNSRIGTTPTAPGGIKRGEALGIAFVLALFTLLAMKAGVFSVQVCVQTEGAATRKELGRQFQEGGSASSPLKAGGTAVFHWNQCLQKMEQGFEDLEMTHRQIQVSRGVLCQRTQKEIAEQLRIDERTVRDHVRSAYKKVGCKRKADFFQCALDAIQANSVEKADSLQL